MVEEEKLDYSARAISSLNNIGTIFSAGNITTEITDT
jgi:hypothetical protein